MLQDALRKALAQQPGLSTETPTTPEPPAAPALPHPSASEWGRLLSGVPADASLGRYEQETAARVKQLKDSGKKREAAALAAARDQFMKSYEKAAWKDIKARWTELDYPERLYRRLKSEDLPLERIWSRLHTRRAEEMRTAGADAIFAWLQKR